MKKLTTLLGILFFVCPLFSQTYLDEDFSTFTQPVQPPAGSGWKNDDSLNMPASDSIWQFVNPGGRTPSPSGAIDSNFAIVDSDFYGFAASQDCYLTSPPFNTSTATTVILEFDHVYQHFTGSFAEVQVYDGAIWQSDTIYMQDTDPTFNLISTHEVIDISKYVVGKSNAQVRFRYFGNFGWYWIIDNIRITQPMPDDLSVISVDSTGVGCGFSTNTSISATIVNVGSTVITGFPIDYSVNGSSAITETVADTLNPGDTSQYTFTTTFDMSMAGTYNIEVYTTLRGDGNQVNDTASGVNVQINSISTFPYTEGFESGNGGWLVSGINSTWAIGTPAKAIINGAANGLNSYVTELTGVYNNNEESYVTSPCFDFSALNAPQLKMNVWWNSENTWDGTAIQSSIDNGSTWQDVGAFGSPNNWFNDITISALGGITTNGQGWTGTTANIGSGGWVLAEHDLTGLANQPSVQLRVVFGSDGSVQEDGFAFDDIFIDDAPAVDVGITEVVSPVTGCSLGAADSVCVMVSNFGSGSISNFPLRYTFNGNQFTDTFRLTLNPGDTVMYCFNTTVNVSTPGSYSLTAFTDDLADGNRLNDSIDYNFDNVPIISSFPYVEGFESGNGGWVPDGSAANSWDRGLPLGININSAANGFNAYVTNLTGDYNPDEFSVLNGPCFDFTNLSNPQIKFNIWWNSEFSWDGLVLQSSTNGITWNDVGTIGAPNNWFNDNTIDGLQNGGLNGEGWTGNAGNNGSGGWVLAEHNLTGLGGQSSVLLRFVFGSDASVQDDGVGIDDIFIDDAPSIDAAVLDLIAPNASGSCGLSNSEPVTIQIRNSGSNVISSIPVSYIINSGIAVTDTISTVVLPGDTIMHTFSSNANLSLPGTYNFAIYSSVPMDGNLLNDTIFRSVDNNLQLGPYFENFDSAFVSGTGFNNAGATNGNGWTSSPEVPDFAWGARTGATGSFGTGPDMDRSGTGNYMYVEGSNGLNGDTATLTSPCINISSLVNPRLSFWYHKFGDSTLISDLYVDIYDGTVWINGVDSILGRTHIANADTFLFRDVTSLFPYTFGTGLIQVRFRTSGKLGFATDIAIDDFSVYERPVSVNNINNNELEFSIYPNPTIGQFELTLPKVDKSVRVEVMNSNGQIVYVQNVQATNQQKAQLDMTGHAKGVYFVKVSDQNASLVKKLILQ